MQGRCEKHPFELAEDRCGRCGFEYCAECLVYSFGAQRPPFCIPCAVAAAGLRTTRAVQGLPRRELRRLEKERKMAFKAARKAEQARQAPEEPAPVREREPVAAPMDMPPVPDTDIGPGYAPSAAR